MIGWQTTSIPGAQITPVNKRTNPLGGAEEVGRQGLKWEEAVGCVTNKRIWDGASEVLGRTQINTSTAFEVHVRMKGVAEKMFEPKWHPSS